MKHLSFIVILILYFKFNIQAQIFEYDLIFTFNDYPIAKNNLSGIGNLGFDSHESLYNPKYNSENENKLAIYLSSNSIINYTAKIPSTDAEVFKGEFIMWPNLSLQYNIDKYSFYIQYFNELLLKNRAVGTWSFHIPSFNGERSITSPEPEFLISNNELQLAVSRKIMKGFSISVGILTNIFRNKQIFGSIVKEISSNFLDNIQILGSINYNSGSISLYLLGKSQAGPLHLNPEIIDLNEDIKFYNNAIISYPGYLGYGIQYKIINPLKISIEMQHEFFNTVYDYKYKRVPYVEPWDRSGKFSKNIFNNEIIIGLNYFTPINLSVGLMYSKYLKYDVDVNNLLNYINPLPKYDNINFYDFSCEYFYANWSIYLRYQVSSTGYKKIPGERDRKDTYQLAILGLGFMLE